jgi:hypothetical protein
MIPKNSVRHGVSTNANSAITCPGRERRPASANHPRLVLPRDGFI